METMDRIRELHPTYEPAEVYRAAFVGSGFVAVTNQIAGSGKDAIKDAVAALCGGISCPSYTDRAWRPSDGPKLGNTSYVYLTSEEMLAEIEAGTIIEYEPLRDYSYATSGREVKSIVEQGKRPFKDLEPNGLITLRRIMGDCGVIRAIYPLPDLTVLADGRTQWEHLLTNRDYEGDRLGDILKGSRGEESANDLAKRLTAAAGQRALIGELGLVEDDNTFFVVNTYGRLAETARVAANFVNHGKITTNPYGSPTGTAIRANLNEVEEIACSALAEAS
ncbi:MAG: hypothetical protein QG623_304 [Patescibacteria group bacterium]|nr:hypothetical protein [Patescibacteria group bacterium]